MQQLYYFLQKFKFFLFFIFLEIIAVALIINNNAFHKSKFISSSNFIAGGVYTQKNKIDQYFKLKRENNLLAQENAHLKNLLNKITTKNDSSYNSTKADSIYKQQYVYITGKIIANNYLKPNNFLTINRGSKHGITAEMAVVNSKGIIGITENVTNNFCRVQSVLNTNSKINARFKNSFHFGTLTWNTNNYKTVQLTDIPRQAQYKIGDTIITGGKSTIFPEGILIGTVASIPDKISASNTISIQLFNDMSNLGHINIISNLHKEELKQLSGNNE